MTQLSLLPMLSDVTLTSTSASTERVAHGGHRDAEPGLSGIGEGEASQKTLVQFAVNAAVNPSQREAGHEDPGSQTVVSPHSAAVAALILVAGLALLVLPQRSHVHRPQRGGGRRAGATCRRAAAARPSRPVKVDAADLFRLSEAMPDADRMPEILVDLSGSPTRARSASRRSGRRRRFRLQGYSALPLAVTVTGKYADVTAFIRRLRDAVRRPHGRLVVNGRLFIVNQIALTSTDGRTVSATLNLDAFDYVPPPAAAGGPSRGSSTTTTAGGST